MKTYSPPARGIIAASSAYVSAPARLRKPAATHAAITSHGVSTLHIITRVFRKMPVPMTLPTTIETAAKTPRPRTSVRVFCERVDMSGFGAPESSRERVEPRAVFDPLRPLRRPGLAAEVRAREGAGQAGYRVGVARSDGGALQDLPRRVRVHQETEEPGRQGLFRDPAGAGREAGVGVVVGRTQ